MSPQLHQRLHDEIPLGSDDHCAVTLFAAGISAPPPSAFVMPPVEQPREPELGIQALETFVESPRYLIRPERGPPSA